MGCGPLFADGTVEGHITDRSTGQPLLGANVVITSPQLESPTGAATNMEGAYRVGNLPEGTYTIRVSYIGFDDETVTTELRASETVVVDFALSPSAIQLEEIHVVTASRRRERIEDAPAAISVISERNIRRESNTNLGDYMKTVKGVDFTQSGVDSYNLSARGFNSSFSSRLLTLTDGRMANVPSLRLIAYNVIPVISDDVQQIEVVLGPSSAMYGPNAHSGVLNIITKPPRLSKPLLVNYQLGDRRLRKISGRAAYTWGNLAAKVSGAYLTATDWQHFNEEELEGHHFGLVGNWHLTRDGLDQIWQTNITEKESPLQTVRIENPWRNGEFPYDSILTQLQNLMLHPTGLDTFWLENDGYYYTFVPFADGIDNDCPSFPCGDSEENQLVTHEMTLGEIPNNFIDDNGNGLIDENDWVGYPYADGIDNDGDGLIDEGIDTGIDDLNEKWYDGIDNDGDGEIDEKDELGDRFKLRFGEYGAHKFGEYIFDKNGNFLFDTNKDGCYGCEGDSTVHSYRVYDSDGDGISDFPDFEVKNIRGDFRLDYDPREDFKMSFAYGYAWAKNINITGIARFLADGWIYRYAQGRMTYGNFFAQAYLNSSFSGNTRSMSTGRRIKDTSRKFSAQLQHHKSFWNDRQRFVWGLDYFRTMPQTFGTILGDDHGVDLIDNDGDGEDGSPTAWSERIDNGKYDPGERFFAMSYDSLDGIDNAAGAIADGIDNDGDGDVDEGIDEKDEDNRYFTNELGFYMQSNTKLSDKLELVVANRFDAHEQLTEMIQYDPGNHSPNPFNWTFNFRRTDGLQISPKVGLIYKPADNQNFRLTWARAFNNPSSQALFLDIFVQRFSVFKVFAKGAADGYHYPRDQGGNLIFWDISGDKFKFNSAGMEPFDDKNGDGMWNYEDGSTVVVYDFWRNPIDTVAFEPNGQFDFMDWGTDGIQGQTDLNGSEGDGIFQEGEPSEAHEKWKDRNGNGDWDQLYKLLFPSTDPSSKGTFQFDIPTDPGPIKPEIVRTWEIGYKGRLARPLYGTLDLYYSKYTSFVSPILFVTPIVVDNDPGLTVEKFFDSPSTYVKGITVVGDTTSLKPGQNPPVVVGYLNYGRVFMWGLDASVLYLVSRGLILEANYSFLSISEFENPLTGTKDPINAPRNKWSFKATYESPKGFSAAAYLRHVDSFPWKAGIYHGTIKRYNIIDVHLGYKINDHLHLWATFNNAFNKRHTEIIGGPKLGRMIVVRLQGSL